MLRTVIILSLATLFGASQCTTTDSTTSTKINAVKTAYTSIDSLDFPDKVEKITKTEAEWKAELSASDYYVLREHGTERAFTGTLLNNKKKGVYTCKACNLPLFASDTKFKSGTGWPSFWQPIDSKYVGETVDKSYGMVRTEVHCNRCDGHLGHVFDDGPNPTGLRYCINSVSLNFVEQ
ncbi:MAG: peptide-methionine (R)-S-oxide reductase MsrB [Saprospiraceae bacterium]